MVATLKPISTHISMKTGRLLGAQATVITAGMKSWESNKEVFKEGCHQRSQGSSSVPHRESDESCGLFSDSQQKRLPQRDAYRGGNLEGGNTLNI